MRRYLDPRVEKLFFKFFRHVLWTIVVENEKKRHIIASQGSL